MAMAPLGTSRRKENIKLIGDVEEEGCQRKEENAQRCAFAKTTEAHIACVPSLQLA